MIKDEKMQMNIGKKLYVLLLISLVNERNGYNLYFGITC